MVAEVWQKDLGEHSNKVPDQERHRVEELQLKEGVVRREEEVPCKPEVVCEEEAK